MAHGITGNGRMPVARRALGALAVVLLAAVPALAFTALGPGLFEFEAPSVAPQTTNPTAESKQGDTVLDDFKFTQSGHLF